MPHDINPPNRDISFSKTEASNNVRPTVETFRPPTPGGQFLFAPDLVIGSIWGDADSVLWAPGEPLLIAGPTGVGKTTLAVQLLKARIGQQASVLGLSVARDERKVLYIAGDRPAEFKRAARPRVQRRTRHRDPERAPRDPRGPTAALPHRRPSRSSSTAPITTTARCSSTH